MENLKDLHPAKQLDLVLEIILNGRQSRITIGYIKDTLELNKIKSDEFTLQIILNKLQKDLLINSEESTLIEHSIDGKNKTGKIISYLISFEGKTLLEVEGGHLGRMENQNKEKNKVEKLQIDQLNQADRLEKIQNRNLVLTLILSVTASVLCVIEVVKFLETHPHFFCFGH